MVAVIGDIHGCFYTLEELYNKILLNYPNTSVYCVGDLVDRGKNSCEVFEFVIEKNIKFVLGNHDIMFYDFFRNKKSKSAHTWILNGNQATLDSYTRNGVDINEHLDFLISAPVYFNLPDCFITHAGISRVYQSIIERGEYSSKIIGKIIEENFRNDDGVLWARGPLLNIGKLQVLGHTKNDKIIYDKEAEALYIDTGACAGNKLSAVIIEGSRIIDTLECMTNFNDIL